jgi:very-short-patch-repair endonuclease
MTEIFNKTNQKSKRKFLRKNMPKAEAVVWIHLKNKQVCGQRFLRQFSFNAFVVDFYSPKLRLAIEIDGVSHFKSGAKEYDESRQAEIEKLGIQFLRFTNDEVFEGISGVIRKIENNVIDLLKNPPTGLLPATSLS